jgi:two-component system response regulator MtrA
MARIIYVEDDDLMGHVVQHVLTQAGHLIGVVSHGTLGFETIAFKKPELVILDLGLPGMSGIEVLKRLRQISGTYMIPILVLTANRSAEAVDEAMGAGANEVMLKPFTPPDLVACVERVLSAHGFGNDLIRRH